MLRRITFEEHLRTAAGAGAERTAQLHPCRDEPMTSPSRFDWQVGWASIAEKALTISCDWVFMPRRSDRERCSVLPQRNWRNAAARAVRYCACTSSPKTPLTAVTIGSRSGSTGKWNVPRKTLR